MVMRVRVEREGLLRVGGAPSNGGASLLLKAKEQMKDSYEKKETVLKELR